MWLIGDIHVIDLGAESDVRRQLFPKSGGHQRFIESPLHAWKLARIRIETTSIGRLGLSS